MLQLWTCEACGASNQMVVSLLKPPPDTVMRICTDCEHEQEVRIPERDPELAARQKQRKIESFRRKSSPAIAAVRP
jgi:transcription elongation factor Elf1